MEPPILAFDKWISRCMLPSDAGSLNEPLLPARRNADEYLIRDLRRGNSLTSDAARAIAAEMAEAGVKAATSLSRKSADEDATVLVTEFNPSLWRLTLSNEPRVHCDCTKSHYTKLTHLHAKHSSGDAQPLCTLAFTMLLRYQALGCLGSQCALPPACFATLRKRLGLAIECFASPLNTTHDFFCSAFADTDAPFGSLGSFFDLQPSEGSFEANPPFEPQTLLAAIRHAESLLTKAEAASKPLSFAFIVPTWEELPFHHQLLRSKWLRGGSALRLSAADHAFVDGAQHLKESAAERFRASSFGTTIGVLQTAKAAVAWPVDSALYEELTVAFREALPSAEETKARIEKGGDRDAVAKLMKRRRK